MCTTSNNFQNGQQDSIKTLKDNMLHIVNITSTRLHAIKARTSANAHIIQNLVQDISKLSQQQDINMASLDTVYQTLETRYESLSFFLSNIVTRLFEANERRSKLSDFLNGVKKLHQGITPYEIISPEEMKRAIHEVSIQIKNVRPEFSLVHKEVGFYFTNHLTTYTYSKRNLFIIIQAPISERPALFEIMRVSSFPVPWHTDSHNKSKGYTKILNLPKFLAVSDQNYFLEVSTPDYLTCSGNRLLVCPIKFATQSRDALTCAAAIYFNSAQNVINDLCKFKIFTNTPPPESVIHIGDNKFQITSDKGSMLHVCQGQVKSQKTCPYCVVTQQCGCSFKTNIFNVPSSFDNCHTSTSKSHTLNWAMVSKFIPSYKPDSTFLHFNSTVGIELPNISDFLSEMKDLSEQDLQLGLNLNDVVDKMNNDEGLKYFKSKGKAEWLPMVEYDSFTSVFFTLFVASTSLFIIILSILYNKIRKLTLALVVLNKIVGSHGLVINSPVETTVKTVDDPTRLFRQVSVLLAAMAVFFTILKCFYFLTGMGCSLPKYRQFRRKLCGPAQDTHSVRLYVKVMNGGTELFCFYKTWILRQIF